MPFLKLCIIDGKPFTARRHDALFCSATCRKTAYERRHGSSTVAGGKESASLKRQFAAQPGTSTCQVCGSPFNDRPGLSNRFCQRHLDDADLAVIDAVPISPEAEALFQRSQASMQILLDRWATATDDEASEAALREISNSPAPTFSPPGPKKRKRRQRTTAPTA